MIARYVESGGVVPQKVLQLDSNSVAEHTMGNILSIRYTNNGFETKKLEVSPGTMIQFVNESNKEMWVASDNRPEHSKLPTFDQFRGIKKGEIYTYVFHKAGIWQYHDHLNPAFVGSIEVR